MSKPRWLLVPITGKENIEVLKKELIDNVEYVVLANIIESITLSGTELHEELFKRRKLMGDLSLKLRAHHINVKEYEEWGDEKEKLTNIFKKEHLDAVVLFKPKGEENWFKKTIIL